jgi:decaprenylphospho-beta-D-erythro-pentofuranosid-2-ulose 2-reductase
MKRILIVGATSRIAEHCARLWVGEAVDLVLAGRDAARLEAIAADLRVRSPQSTVTVVVPPFLDPEGVGRFVAGIDASGAIDIALVAQGQLPEQGACERDLRLVGEAISVNALSPVLFAEALVGAMLARGRGTVAVIGSVAGDRGRQSNYVYGAAKGLVDRYLQGLRHRCAGSGVRVVMVKPGPTDTPMTAELAARGARLASPEAVARDIVRGIARGRSVVYTPGLWRLVMLVIRHVPEFLFVRTRL